MLHTTCAVLFLLTFSVDKVKADDGNLDGSELSTVTVSVILCASVVLLIIILALCGGCTPMEVGSDNHAASGGYSKSNTQYSSVVTDVNTQIMSAGTSLPNDPYSPHDRGLPYDPHPQTANRFTGYQSQQQPSQAQTGYGINQQQGFPSAMAGANRPYTDTEPPPPSYNEAIQPSAPSQGQVPGNYGASGQAQSYGW